MNVSNHLVRKSFDLKTFTWLLSNSNVLIFTFFINDCTFGLLTPVAGIAVQVMLVSRAVLWLSEATSSTKIGAPPPYKNSCMHTWAHARIYFRWGHTVRTDKNYLFVDLPEAQMTIIAVFRRYRLNLRIYASAEGVREKL